MTVKVVKPIKITEAVLTASSMPEPDASVGEVEWVEDRREIVNVDFGGQTVDTFNYDRAHYIPDQASTGIGEVAEVLFESIFVPPNQPIVEAMIYKHIKTSAGKSEFNYDRIQSYDVTGHIGASSKVFSFATETFTTAKTVGGVYIFIKDSTNNKIVAVNVTSIPFSSVQLPIPTSTSLSNFTSANFNIVDGKAFCIGRDAATIKELYVRWDLASQVKEDEFYIDNSALSTGQAMLFGDKLRIYELRGAYKSDSYYSTSTTYSNPILVQAPQKFGEYIVTTFTDGTDVYMAQGDAPPSLSIIEIYKGSNDTSLGYYQPGERAILTSTHKLYQCVKATNIRPDLGATGDETESWVEVGATNKFASFDDRLFYPAKITGTQTFELTIPDRLNTVAFLNLSGITSVRVQMDVGGSIVYDKTKDALDFSLIYDHYTWWFSDSELLTELIFDDLPPYPNSKLIIDVTGEGDLGQIVTGFGKEIGVCLAESSSNTIDLSTQEFDAFGNRKYVPRPIIKLNKYEILSDKSAGPAIERLFKEIAGGNALWIGDIGGDQLLTTYGYTERSPIPYNMPNDINYSATIRGSA